MGGPIVEATESGAVPTQQCLETKCPTFYAACKITPPCKTDLIGCMDNCTDNACDSECFKTAGGKMSKLFLPELIALSTCGGSYGCFDRSKGMVADSPQTQIYALYYGACYYSSKESKEQMCLQGAGCWGSQSKIQWGTGECPTGTTPINWDTTAHRACNKRC